MPKRLLGDIWLPYDYLLKSFTDKHQCPTCGPFSPQVSYLFLVSISSSLSFDTACFDVHRSTYWKSTLFYTYTDLESLIKQLAKSNARNLITRKRQSSFVSLKLWGVPFPGFAMPALVMETYLVIAQTEMTFMPRARAERKSVCKEYQQYLIFIYLIAALGLPWQVVCGWSSLLSSIQPAQRQNS